ncbi:16S rRNA (cytosine(1402)-N(4))-methyltransferase RsmH [Deinococcus deserti]|uniref:Ribosomal RNA small subunit methyltransferase H n=1 Tax=Deinococcus deserti (strain DSM 17065 / CIP 109153 / LMG 22923 / VCD115) TaxID=546414 RepID=RSMH_DEIDV|nr:16S rRNA (cytosine(1402)-N(4))-methyltransferase RsmH [Deinococcus deserti]C1D1L8.1 RecName: Full=Ribosomal RNA small subunit methyltransferase H; AltName: Full=16S rRNA m(4)C1402 methyltransferase; AltName: Full=rRNA (cytosine-N(4)-)-methyltransferase RsmH [Deinococcus deserti VCD115]ACO45742.1 putative Methyltransferase [Deinococcus deserti VCD115]
MTLPEDTTTAESLIHTSVLSAEVLEALAPTPGKTIVDGTLGGAGHTRLLLEAGAHVYGIDQDPFALDRAREAGLPNLTVLQGNYRDMVSLLEQAGVSQVDGILLDIGVSSFQLDDAGRGFSYHTEAPLDMRMSQSGESAADVVNTYEEEDLAAIIYEYGEDRLSRRIARAIGQARQKAPIETTVQLAEIVKRAYPGFSKGIHPARRTFQALRIHVNDELGALRDGLQAAETLLRPGGRLAVISFHSLEDRIVKRFLLGSEVLQPLTKRPVVASDEEQAINPRSRSAKLRAAERVVVQEAS